MLRQFVKLFLDCHIELKCLFSGKAMADTYCELLISQVKNCRLLWDMKHKNYHNRLLVDREWNRIAEDYKKQVS